MKRTDLMRALEEAGYTENTKKGKGAHTSFEKPGFPSIQVPYGRKHRDISPGLLNSVFRKAGISIDRDTGKITIDETVKPQIHRPPGAPCH